MSVTYNQHPSHNQPSPSPYSQGFENTVDDSHRPWSIRLANSRLHSRGLESALESDLHLQMQEEKERGIPMTILSSSESVNNQHSPSTVHPVDTSVRSVTQSGNLKHKTYGFSDPFDEAPMAAWQEMKDYNLRANGLPTLDQMMRVHTRQPLTQSNFVAFLRRRGAHQNLNFLLELETHEKLWSAHLQSEHRQNKDRLSRFLESAAEKPANTKDTMMTMYTHGGNNGITGSGSGYIETSDKQNLLGSQTYFQMSHHNHTTTTLDEYASRNPSGRSLSRLDLQQNATRIYRTFCSPHDAAQPIHLPDDHRQVLNQLIEKHHRPEPVVFESARSHVFEVLNVFYYPQFIDTMLNSNISCMTSRLLVVLGVLLLTLAFAIELSFIFLDSGSMTTRWWGIIPFFFGWTCMLAGFSDFAWWITFTRKSETSFFVFTHIQDKTVMHMHRKRAIFLLVLTVALSVISNIIFVFIPGNRLRAV
ncbi:hypothetical protein BX666DRAFT_1920012 [Dichotomocladium elegans]|nr:hypothetical protein BX666DRAFT_1920012 [Dichotomocladium elegans]